MTKVKQKNLQRALAIYLAGSMLFSGVAYAAADSTVSYREGQATVVEKGSKDGIDGIDELYGGSESYGDGEATKQLSSTSITVKSGSVGAAIGGGASEGGSTKNEIGTTNIAVQGGTVKFIQGGSDAYENTTSSVTTANINISGGTIASTQFFITEDGQEDAISYSGIVGGGAAYSDNGGTTTANVTTANINISGGTIKKAPAIAGKQSLFSDVFGGGVAIGDANGTGNATAHVGTVNMNISGGVIETDVYAGGATANIPGGSYSGTLKSTVDNATINISGGEIKGNVYAGGMNAATVGNATINISGGKIGGNVSAKDNVTGSSILNFTQGTGSTIDGVIEGFDTVKVRSGANATLTGTNVADGTAVLQAGRLDIEELGTLRIPKTMTLDLGGAAAVFSLRSARVAGGLLNLSGKLDIAPGAELTLDNTVLKSNNDGMVNVGVAPDGSVGKLTMAGTGNFYNDEINLNIAQPVDVIYSMSEQELNSILDGALTKAVKDALRIGNAENAEYQYVEDKDGNVIGTKINERYFSFYTGVRQANAYIAKNMIANIHERNAALRSGEKADEFWINIRGGKTDVDNKYGKSEVKHNYYQLGYDWDLSSGKEKAAIGVYASKIYGDTKRNGLKSDINSAYDFGIYGVKEFSGGAYLGLVSRYGQIKNAAKVYLNNIDWTDKGYALSAELGKRFVQQDGWSLEPYMQLTYNHLSAANFKTAQTEVTLGSSSLLDGKLGVRFIKQEKENKNNNFYAGLAYERGLSGSFKLNGRATGLGLVETKNDGNAFEVALGVNRQISKSSTVNLDVKKEFGDYDGWNVQGMFNLNF